MIWIMFAAFGVGLALLGIAMWRDNTPTIIAGVVLMAAGIGIAIYGSIQDDNRWTADCHKRGGHVISHTDTVTTINAKGQPGIGTSTTDFCLSHDGRILSIN